MKGFPKIPGIYKTKSNDNFDSELPSGYVECYYHPIMGLVYCDDQHDGEFYNEHLPVSLLDGNIEYKLNKKQIAVLKSL